MKAWNPARQEMMISTHLRHEKRINYLKKKLINCIFEEIWECEYDDLLQYDNEFKLFIKNCELSEPIRPRDALFGGRTNAFKLYHKCNENEEIKYVDFTSLYPYVQKYCEYPIGHPKIITENFDRIENYFGIIKCVVLPPKKLYLPILPAKINNKLIFSLCRTCAFEKIKNCYHSNEERQIEGTWISLEVIEAVKNGYKILKIFEVWHYEERTKFDKNTKTGGLFTDYVDLFLKGKQEANGFPDNVVTEDDKLRYQKDYYENEGILLDLNNIEKNPGLRTVMKLCLNSFWGRFGINNNKIKTKFIYDFNEWNEMLINAKNGQYIIHDVDFSSQKYLICYYSYNKEFFDGCLTGNIPIAAFVTCHARLKLLSEMKKLCHRLLYCDTDSLIYVSNNTKDEYEPLIGDYLGQLTNEIDKKDGKVIEYAATAPKSYTYKTDKGYEKCVIKGFTLNYLASLKLNFEAIKNIVLEEPNKKIQVEQTKFTRCKTNWDITTSILNKSYSFYYDKRVLLDDLSTLPYGF